ncbi:DUF1707 SHOCT-like domain-containing protein [Micromonospora inositola]|uniref:DUF1707 domain-containing protein n=1 Tax=Micromonospora inositola TaxID=47865 RepID=A0A1C5HJG2_9ACTN|nr:DUF1707 domain-containing protein [Micromonospora inositola]SCG46118.1 protein of unknown function [Micromonospora inositola]
MTEELVPRPEMRVSDAERERVVEQLNQAVGEGRLTLAEFEDRIGGVLAARTHGDLAPFTADLPATGAPQVLELRSRASSLKRAGRWVVPRRVVVKARSSSVRLDLTEAVIVSPTVEVLLDVRSSSVTVVLPHGASASVDEVEMSSSSARAGVPDSGGLHVVMRGHLQTSSLTVRHQRRFLRWRW